MDAWRRALEAAARERELGLTTYGRKTGKPHRVTIWIVSDGEHMFIRSGEGFRRDWPQNLVSRGSGEPLTPGEQATFELLPAEEAA